MKTDEQQPTKCTEPIARKGSLLQCAPTLSETKINNMIESIELAGTVVGYLTKSLKENKDFKSFASDFTSAAIKWIRPVFLTDDEKPTSILADLKNDPDDILSQESAKIEIAKLVKNNPASLEDLQELVNQINKIEAGLTSGYTINQTHFGTGDNVGRDKLMD